MSKVKNMPFGISIFLILFALLELYYFFVDFFTFGLFNHYGYVMGDLENIAYLLITIFLFTVLLVAIALIIYGFLNRRDWARKFAIIYIIWAMFWPLWGLIVGNAVAFHAVLFIIYILCIIYLMTEYVKEYFREAQFFTYGEWTLYRREVTLLSGKTLTIHFFSKKTPHSGTACPMPEGYEVGINPRSHMPYLQKIGKPKPYKYKDYTLYTRKVTLKSGKTLTIYFFSNKKPHSGKPCPMPEGYEVGINPRSSMPYLQKKGHKKAKKVEAKPAKKEEVKPAKKEEPKSRKPANVIYVVSKPQPGSVKGDWAVRSHGKIYSHHRIKENAIKAARVVAKKRDATVMVQNTDGTFSDGFKPKK